MRLGQRGKLILVLWGCERVQLVRLLWVMDWIVLGWGGTPCKVMGVCVACVEGLVLLKGNVGGCFE